MLKILQLISESSRYYSILLVFNLNISRLKPTICTNHHIWYIFFRLF